MNYRTLKHNEIIKEGDEVDTSIDAWSSAPIWEPTRSVGQKAPDPKYPAHRIYRRKVTNDYKDESR